MMKSMIKEKCLQGITWVSDEWFRIAKSKGHFLPKLTDNQNHGLIKGRIGTPRQKHTNKKENIFIQAN